MVLVWQFLLAFLTCKFPKYFVNLHSPLLILSYILLRTYLSESSHTSQEFEEHDAMQYSFFLICGLLLNGCWFITAFSILANSSVNIYYSSSNYGLEGLDVILFVVMFALVVIYGSYYYEAIKKNDFLKMIQIEKMNENFQNLLMNLPKPIILIDNHTNEVTLANQQICNLFSIKDYNDKKSIK